MGDKVKIFGLVGSPRGASINRRLMSLARKALGARSTLDVFDRLRDIPPFDEDREISAPQCVEDLRARIRAADAVLVVTPEYNGSVPGQLKNAIDWASRPFAVTVLRGKPVAVMGSSPSPGGARAAIADAQRILGRAGASVIAESASVPYVFEHLDHAGALTGPEVCTSVAVVTRALVAVADPGVTSVPGTAQSLTLRSAR